MQGIRDRYQTLRSNERGQVSRKQRGLGLDVALAYPNTYHIGMSNLGFQAVYQLFNSHRGITCERVFVPDADIERELERTDSSLISLESETAITQFDVLAISVSFETDYLNIPKLLRLSK